MPPERLDIGSVGEDVARLHKALEARGFVVSAEETKRRFFGPSTRDALRDCQTCHGLNATGEVDDPTTALLNATRPAAPAGAAFAPETAGPARVPAEAEEQPTAPIAGAAVPPPSEFERHLQMVTARVDGTGIARLTDRQRDEVAQETGIDRAQLDVLARAATLRDRIDRLSGAEVDQGGDGFRRNRDHLRAAARGRVRRPRCSLGIRSRSGPEELDRVRRGVTGRQ